MSASSRNLGGAEPEESGEWVRVPAFRDEPARARAIATRKRADTIRRSLQGRHHSDSAELVAEDRQR
jgi:hypothetical protein